MAKEEKKEKDIKETKEDSIGYSGKIEIGTYSKGKRHKRTVTNEGTVHLFTYLGNCLAARLNPNVSVSIADRPGSLALLNAADVNVLTYNIPFNDVTITVTDTSTPSCSVEFFFLIPGTAVLGKSIKNFRLKSVNGDKDFAKASLSKPLVVTDVDTNIYVS